MESPAIPYNEVERLEALHRYELLNTLPEKSYNDIISIAAHICNVPISLISLVDKDRCWFKAKLGLEQEEAPRRIAYAAHAINTPSKVMVVEDALADERFCDCPLVLQDPPMRFYAGTPLVTPDGFAIGTLCVIDKVPRQLNEQQINTLQMLANQVVSQFELRLKMKQVRQLNQQLNESYKDLESFSYSVAHDLRAPLKNIRGLMSLLEEEYGQQFGELGEELIQNMVVASDQMGAVIDSLWQLSTISTQRIVKQQVDISSICKNVLKVQENIEHYTIYLQENLTARGDASLLRLALENLIGNAVKYSRQQKNPVISIGQLSKENQSLFYVKDNGVGFDDQVGVAIFKPFQRFHTADEFEGNGIGLSIVQKVIKCHGGKIWAESTPGQGTTFFFTLTFPLD